MEENEAPSAPATAPPLRGRSIDRAADRGSSVRPSWRRRLWQWMASGRGIAAGGLLAVFGVLGWGMYDTRFVVHTVTVSGNRLVDSATLAQLADVRGEPIWAIEPGEVEARLHAHPYVASATVTLHLPDEVQIDMREPRHAITWEAGAQRYAIAPDGRLAPLAASVPISETAIIHDWRTAPLSANARVSPTVVALAQMLLVRLPAETGLAIQSLGWDPAHGLVVQTSDGCALLWGDSETLDRQLQIVQALKQQQVSYRVLDLRGQIAAYRTADDPTLPVPASTSTLSTTLQSREP